MATQIRDKLNRLQHLLPEGLLTDAAWLTQHGYSTSLRRQYVTAGWLVQPVRRVYQRPNGSLKWQQVIISLQTLLHRGLVVGGRSALESQGFSHYLTKRTREVHLYGSERPPSWLEQLPLNVSFVYHHSGKLFAKATTNLDSTSDSLVFLPWGQREWQLHFSSPERAILELLDQLPGSETFHQADKLMEGLSNLRPRRLQKLLVECRNVKVKRLFFFFADRHGHAWLKRIDKSAINLGKGKRMLVRGGKLDKKYQITVPKDFHGSQ